MESRIPNISFHRICLNKIQKKLFHKIWLSKIRSMNPEFDLIKPHVFLLRFHEYVFELALDLIYVFLATHLWKVMLIKIHQLVHGWWVYKQPIQMTTVCAMFGRMWGLDLMGLYRIDQQCYFVVVEELHVHGLPYLSQYVELDHHVSMKF